MRSKVSPEIAQRIKSYVEWATEEIWEEVIRNLDASPELQGRDLVSRVQEVAQSTLLGRFERQRAAKNENPLNAPQPHWSKTMSAELREFVLFHAHHRQDVKKIAETFEITLSKKDEPGIFSDAFHPVHWKRRVLEQARRADEVTTAIQKAQNIYKAFLDQRPEIPISRMTSIGAGITLGVLEAIVRPPELKDAQKRLGFNQPTSDSIRRQGFWNEMIVKLVDRIDPRCERGKQKGSNPQVKDKTLKFVARLLHTFYPDVWTDPNNYRSVGKRYRDEKKRQQKRQNLELSRIA